jgi:Transglutaminase elicitor
LHPAGGGQPVYNENPVAESFRYVELDVRYITESSPSRQTRSGNLAAFTRTDSLKLILELDKRGRVVGGEWVGESRDAHPDFMWWPSGKPAHSIASMLSYAELKKLYDQAVAP